MLALDLDPARVAGDVHDGAVQYHRERHADPVSEVGAQAEALAGLVARYGGLVLTDVSPSGGRHVFILFASPLPWRELRDLCRAMAARFPAIDPAPMASLGGQISPPGSRHKSGGWRTLSTSPEEAAAACGQRNGPAVWAGLLMEFAAELQALEASAGVAPGATPELDDTGAPWVPRLGGRAPLGGELERVARTGRWDRSRYAGRSEARMAVLCAAAARGWRLADMQALVASTGGPAAWKGLAGLYERVSEPGRMARLLPLEWRKAVDRTGGQENVRNWLTSDINPRPPADSDGLSAEYGLIRQWVTATDCAAADPGRVRGWGRRAIAVRQLLAAIGQAAMVSGSSVIEFGTRNLSLHAGLGQRTVSRLLRILREEPDPLVDLVSPRRMARADRYALRIPDRYAESVRWRRRRAGRVEAIHPAFLILGGTAGLVYQSLGPEPARGAEVTRAARLSASAAAAALRVLAEHGLAERGPGGWCRGPIALADVAESTGAAALQREREERYKRDRESWRARLRQYVSARSAAVAPRDGWLGLDDEDDWAAMVNSRWPVLSDDFVRGPPSAGSRESA